MERGEEEEKQQRGGENKYLGRFMNYKHGRRGTEQNGGFVAEEEEAKMF